MVEWSKDQYVNPNSQTSLGKSVMGYLSRLYAIYKKLGIILRTEMTFNFHTVTEYSVISSRSG